MIVLLTTFTDSIKISDSEDKLYANETMLYKIVYGYGMPIQENRPDKVSTKAQRHAFQRYE